MGRKRVKIVSRLHLSSQFRDAKRVRSVISVICRGVHDLRAWTPRLDVTQRLTGQVSSRAGKIDVNAPDVRPLKRVIAQCREIKGLDQLID